MKPCPFCEELPYKRIVVELSDINIDGKCRCLTCEVGCPNRCAKFYTYAWADNTGKFYFNEIEKAFYNIEAKWNTRPQNGLYDI